jgi:subtilisin family serine protease
VSRRMMTLLAVFALALAVMTPATSATEPDTNGLSVPVDVVNDINAQKVQTYIIQMLDNPVVAYEGGIGNLKATAPGQNKKIDPNSRNVKNYVGYLVGSHDDLLASVGGQKVTDYVYTYNGFAATLSADQANQLLSNPAVVAVSPNEMYTIDTSTTPDYLGLTAEGGAWDQGYVGEDIIIGVVDSGIWPESGSFSDRTGTNNNGVGNKLDYHQIPGWHGKCTPGEDFNASDCNQKLIGAQYFNDGYGGDAGIDAARPWEFNSPRDYNGHGTHTASTSGGNGGVAAEAAGIDLGTVSGMAPRARIAVYKALWSNEDGSQASGFTVDLVAAIDQAVADGVDVINYSVSGSTTVVNTPAEIAFLFAADAGVFVAASAGNEGPDVSTVAHNTPWLTTVAAGTHDRYYAGTVTLGNSSTYDGASLDTRGAGPADLVYGGDVVLAGEDPGEAALCYPGTLDPAQVTGKIVVCDRGTIARVDKSYAVMIAGGIGMVHANTSAAQSINADLHFVPTVHVDNVAGDAIRAYAQTSGATATLTGGVLESVEAPEVAAFSSRGPALAGSGDLLKPDILAPGVDVLAAVAPPGNAGRNFDFYSGTSMAAPHIAGIAAVLMSAHPDWTPMMVKSAIMTTASTETNFGNPIAGDPFDFGAGEVAPNSALDPGLVYNAGWYDWLAFLCETSDAVSASTCSALQGLGYSTDPSDFNVASIAIGALPGAQTVTRTVTNVGSAGTYDVSVDAPAGIDVTVSPASLSLGTGQSASYEVTFTANASSVADTYTFGSLTWSDGSHSVTSPIALMPVSLAAPAEVSGAGTNGSTSFDVTFGYDGTYTAETLGLEPAVMTNGYVEDDPGDSFTPFGPGTTLHMINVPVGSAYARFSLFDAYTDGNDDLDLYVYYPSGSFAGGSGSGTSAEQVDVANPPAGDYYVFVHGWGTDGPDANYTLFSWAVGPDNGNMTVSPTTVPASIGASQTIDVSWAGLSTGTKYLGAVGHTDGTNSLGLTLVSVATD